MESGGSRTRVLNVPPFKSYTLRLCSCGGSMVEPRPQLPNVCQFILLGLVCQLATQTNYAGTLRLLPDLQCGADVQPC